MAMCETYSEIYSDCILKKPSRLKSPNQELNTVNYIIPDEVQNRHLERDKFNNRGKSMPNSSQPYEFYVPDDILIRNDVIVARDPRHPLQMIVGPKDFVESVMLSHFYLQNFFGKSSPLYKMDLIASNSYNVDKPYDVKVDGYLWTQNLLNELKIEQMRQKYSKYGQWNQEKPHVGIRRDIPWPVFFMQYNPMAGPREIHEIAIKQASDMVHDFTHHLLSVSGYQASGPVSERICLRNQAIFLESMYCSNLLNKSSFYGWTLGIDRDMPQYLSRIVKHINDYKNGGFEALQLANKSFGYRIPTVPENAIYPDFKDFR